MMVRRYRALRPAAWAAVFAILLQALLPAYEATPFGFDPDIYVVTHQARYRALKVGLFLDFLDTAFRPKVHWQHVRQTTR